MSPAIAIVGMSCRYPDARSPGELWENVLAQRRAFRRLPAERMRLEDYFSSDRSRPDTLYAAEAAVIEGYEFDRVRFRVAGSTYRAADLAHWLALDVATQALADAGFADGTSLPRETTGVIVGNTLTGEFSRANVLRLRWPYVKRVVEAGLAHEGIPPDQRRALLERLEADYKEPFPAVGEETLAGGLSNTIAGRICNHFDLKGGGYTVDGACAASLLAVTTACQSLESGDLDLALAGGVDLSLDPFELVGFAKAGALAADDMKVYDLRSQGFWPGEGCGFVTLMREADALAQGRRIYALIRGWGVSSDGSGGITRPEVDGQILALRRAYRRAGYGPETVAYFEGHGTGTPVGDATELEVISKARTETGAAVPPAAIGSIKANIGHTKAAAGIAGLLKATLAAHHGVLPPTTGCDQPHATLTGPTPALRVLATAAPWPADHARRVSVSAMGFGGINTHLTLEAPAPSVAETVAPAAQQTWQDAELFLFGATDVADLERQVRRLSGYAARLSRAELGDCAATLAQALDGATVRAAVVASRPAELAERLATLLEWIAAGARDRIDAAAGVFLGVRSELPRIGFLFSGQAAPVRVEGGALARRFASVRELYARTPLPATADTATAVAQPAIMTASFAALAVLERSGVVAAAAVGHSLGEITALGWAGAIDADAAIRIAFARGKAMMGTPGPPSGMLSVAAAAEDVRELLAGTSAVIAGLNLPLQTVVAGERNAIDAVATRARARGVGAVRLPVSHAFHSPLMAPAAPALAAGLARETWQPLAGSVRSTITGAALEPDADLRTLLIEQLTSPVRFMDAMRGLADIDLLVEVGPGQILAGMARELHPAPAIAIDASGPSLGGLLRAFGAAFALGAPIRQAALFEDRFTRPFDLDWSPRFFENPCERAPIPSESAAEPARATSESTRSTRTTGSGTAAVPRTARTEPAAAVALEVAALVETTTETPLDLMRRLVAERAELPLDAVSPESRLLDDLHLNSISVAQLAATAAKRLGLTPSIAPTDFADATVAEVALALDERLRNGGSETVAAPARLPDGAGTWIRTFTVEHVARPAPPRTPGAGTGPWRVFAPVGYPLREGLEVALAEAPGPGIVACLPPNPDDRHVALLLEASRAALAGTAGTRFVLVQHGGGAAGFARTLFLESPQTTTCVVDVPLDHPHAVEWIVGEAATAAGYAEVHYDAAGVRRQPVLRPFELPAETGALPLGADDVLLVTGGGKGIAAECALALARETGCRLALMGRSDPAADAELAANLERMRAAGIRVHYAIADVSDAEAVRTGLEHAEEALGPVDAILCGAGVNEPQLLKHLDQQAFMRTMAAKVQGAINVLGSVDLRRLKLFVAFGSIIARTGMRGEADYALANEWLTRLTERLQEQCPGARCLSIEWSVWSGVGMGERLGRIDALAEMGVTPISPDEGIAILRRLIAAPLGRTSVVVAGRFGGLPTLEVEDRELPLLRFLERPRVHFPGIELVAEAVLSRENDPYLEDHAYGGERLLPAVVGLEAMAQVAMAVTGRDTPPSFEDVRFDRPIVVAADSVTPIRIAALVHESGAVDVVVRSAETDFQADHFRATCRFDSSDGGNRESNSSDAGGTNQRRSGDTLGGDGDGPVNSSDAAGTSRRRSGDTLGSAILAPPRYAKIRSGILPPADLRMSPPASDSSPLPDGRIALEPERDLYGSLLFHRGRFRRLAGYTHLTATSCVAEIGAADGGAWFGRYLPERLVLGDAAARDATIHALQACIPHATILPIGIERLTVFTVLEQGARVVHARERSRHDAVLIYDLDVTDADGRLLERWEGLSLRIVAAATAPAAWPIALVAPYVERRVGELVPGVRIAVAIERAGEDRSDAVIHRALGVEVRIARRPDGKPVVEDGRAVSSAHGGGLTMAVAGAGRIGCDLEPVVKRDAAVWADLLGPERAALAGRIASESGEEFDAAATRVWAAIECLKKAGVSGLAPLVLRTTSRDGWTVLASGEFPIATATLVLDSGVGGIVLAVTKNSE